MKENDYTIRLAEQGDGALLSALFLGEPPQLYHALAFALIVGGIVASSRQ